MKTVLVHQQRGPHLKLLEVLTYYNIVEGLTKKEEDRLLSTKEDLFAIGTDTLLKELVGISS
jgi:hypothetical protein